MDAEHRAANRAYAKLFSVLAYADPNEAARQWDAILPDPQLTPAEREFLVTLGEHHAMIPNDYGRWEKVRELLKSSDNDNASKQVLAPIGRPPLPRVSSPI